MKRFLCRLLGHPKKERYRRFIVFADGFSYRSRVEHCDRCWSAISPGT